MVNPFAEEMKEGVIPKGSMFSPREVQTTRELIRPISQAASSRQVKMRQTKARNNNLVEQDIETASQIKAAFDAQKEECEDSDREDALSQNSDRELEKIGINLNNEPMSYLRSLYANDDFQKLKKVEEEEMYSQAKKDV